MALSEIDRKLLERCLAREPRSWQDFVDRYMGLVVHVINHTALSRSIRLSPEDRDDLSSEVFLALVNDNFAVLRHFRGESSLATYLTVVARRVVVHQLLRRKTPAPLGDAIGKAVAQGNGFEQRLSDREQVERLLGKLEGTEAEVIRLYHLEGKSYREISDSVGMPENSVGPTLSRARDRLRQSSSEPT